VDYLKSIEFAASGDLEGIGKWTFIDEGNWVTLQHDWQVKTTQQWLNVLTPVLKPLLAWNHDEIMRWGAKGLAQKLSAKLIQY
ncbi:MAG TPA: polyketide cyclase, partial [Cyanobacteria bacterium UBA11148]|nr:polyketide cyclase [Cyanobacteria bacterium UBA11148]